MGSGTKLALNSYLFHEWLCTHQEAKPAVKPVPASSKYSLISVIIIAIDWAPSLVQRWANTIFTTTLWDGRFHDHALQTRKLRHKLRRPCSNTVLSEMNTWPLEHCLVIYIGIVTANTGHVSLFISSFIHSINKYLLRAHSVPGREWQCDDGWKHPCSDGIYSSKGEN